MARIVWALMVKKTFTELWLRRRKPTDSREDVGAEEGKELYGATVVRRDWENQGATECFWARGLDLDLIFEHHTGPRHLWRRIMRPDIRQHPTTRQNQLWKYLLRLGSGLINLIDYTLNAWFKVPKMGDRMSNLYWLSEAQMDRLRPYFPKSRGRARVDDRRVLSGIIFINRNGLRWCDAPSEYGPPKTLYNRWKRWSDMGVFARIMMGLAEQAPDNKTISIDATYLKAHRTTSSLGLKKGGVGVW
jgi:transposase